MTYPTDAMDFVSPSLVPSGGEGGPAFELKYLVDEQTAAAVEAWARDRLRPDPHGDPKLGGAYHTTSLYTDTSDLDVFHRSRSYRRRKFRVRRYGASVRTFLERKTKSGDRVAKRRIAVPDGDLALLAHAMSLVDWPGHWFHRGLALRRLQPACLIAYERIAYVGACPEGPLRLTLDRHARGILARDWRLAPFTGGLPLLIGHIILELKFRSTLPSPFRELAQRLRLNPFAISKYRLCREAWGVSSSSRIALGA